MLKNNTIQRLAVVAVSVAALSGCGFLKGGSSGPSVSDPNDPNRVAARVDASISTSTPFSTTTPTNTANFTAVLFDANNAQFYGPVVSLNGTAVPTTSETNKSATIYQSTALPYSVGSTFNLSVQGHTATSPPGTPTLTITQPTPTLDTSQTPPVPFTYYVQTHGSPLTVSWTGGDPSQPVYIVAFGAPDNNGDRRLFVLDNPALAPDDINNFGLPIPDSGTYTIPATVLERYRQVNGTIATRTTTLFDNPNKTGDLPRIITVYVVQRSVTTATPITFATNVIATADIQIVAYQ